MSALDQYRDGKIGNLARRLSIGRRESKSLSTKDEVVVWLESGRR
jgi:hypothetical protein